MNMGLGLNFKDLKRNKWELRMKRKPSQVAVLTQLLIIIYTCYTYEYNRIYTIYEVLVTELFLESESIIKNESSIV